jgi:hypothetical protein
MVFQGDAREGGQGPAVAADSGLVTAGGESFYLLFYASVPAVSRGTGGDWFFFAH